MLSLVFASLSIIKTIPYAILRKLLPSADAFNFIQFFSSICPSQKDVHELEYETVNQKISVRRSILKNSIKYQVTSMDPLRIKILQ